MSSHLPKDSDSSKGRVSIHLPRELYEALELQAAELGLGLAEHCQALIREALESGSFDPL